MVRRMDDKDTEDWRAKRSADMEKLFRWAMAIIGFLILTVCSLAWRTVSRIEDINIENQKLVTGNSALIKELRTDVDLLKQNAVWTEKEKKEYEAIRSEVLIRWGFAIVTRGGQEILLKQPIKESGP